MGHFGTKSCGAGAGREVQAGSVFGRDMHITRRLGGLTRGVTETERVGDLVESGLELRRERPVGRRE